MTQVMSYGSRPSAARRINVRVLVIVAVFGCLVGFPVYWFVKATLNHGIEHLSSGADLVNLKAMGNFPFDGRNGTLAQVPKDFRDLDGKTVVLDGFVYAGQSAADQINSFQLVWSIQQCCFSGPPQVQERVFAVIPDGKYIYNPGIQQMCRLTGKMHVRVEKDEAGNISSVYRLDVTDMKPVS